jgi:hypothetical protein
VSGSTPFARIRSRAGTSLVEMVLVIGLGGLITAAAVSTIAPTNELARAATESIETQEGARSTVYLLASSLRRVQAGGVLLATADSVVVAMPVAVGAFCANDGSRLSAYLGLGDRALVPAVVDGYAIRNSYGNWGYTAYAGTSLFSNATPGRTACIAAGGGAAGRDSDYFRFSTSTSIVPGTGFLVWDRQTFRFGASVLDPTTRGFHYGPTGGASAEVAYGLHAQSGFRYRLRGSTTWYGSVSSYNLRNIDAIRVLTSGANEAAPSDMMRDIPLMNAE